MERPTSSLTYLDRYLEPYVEDAKIAFEYDGLFRRPLAEVEYRAAGEVELRADNIGIFYEYRPASSVPEKATSTDLFGVIDDWRDLVDLVIINTESGVERELASLYPTAYRTTFRVSDDDCIRSYHWSGQRMVVMASPLMTSRHILSMLHEVGHAVGYTLYPHLYDDTAQDLLLYDADGSEAQSIRLAQERNAWAYAVDAIRPFVSNDSSSPFYYKAISEFVHKEFLQTYSNRIIEKRQEMANGTDTMAA